MAGRKRRSAPAGQGQGASQNVSVGNRNTADDNTTLHPAQMRSVYAGLTRLGDVCRTADGWLVYQADGALLGSFYDIKEARAALREAYR